MASLVDERLDVLEKKVEGLNSIVRQLVAMIDPEDLHAAADLAKTSPSNAQLQAWAAKSVPPEELLDVQEERPW
jgi:hypothetical protein